jgi:hypothetical protein
VDITAPPSKGQGQKDQEKARLAMEQQLRNSLAQHDPQEELKLKIKQGSAAMEVRLTSDGTCALHATT